MEDFRTQEERKACDAVIRLIQKRGNIRISFVEKIDARIRTKEVPDYKYRSDKHEYIVEHTLIESFPRQIEDGQKLVRALGHLEKNLKNKLPKPGYYNLWVPAQKMAETNDSTISKSVEKWILETAPKIPFPQPPAQQKCIEERPDGLPFKIRLCRVIGLDGKFFLGRLVPPRLKIQRAKRISTVFSRKLPKLRKFKKRSTITVLVLESNDIALGNLHEIGEVVSKQVRNYKFRKDIPDRIYLIETGSGPYITVLKENDLLFTEIDDFGPHRAPI